MRALPHTLRTARGKTERAYLNANVKPRACWRVSVLSEPDLQGDCPSGLPALRIQNQWHNSSRIDRLNNQIEFAWIFPVFAAIEFGCVLRLNSF